MVELCIQRHDRNFGAIFMDHDCVMKLVKDDAGGRQPSISFMSEYVRICPEILHLVTFNENIMRNNRKLSVSTFCPKIALCSFQDFIPHGMSSGRMLMLAVTQAPPSWHGKANGHVGIYPNFPRFPYSECTLACNPRIEGKQLSFLHVTVTCCLPPLHSTPTDKLAWGASNHQRPTLRTKPPKLAPNQHQLQRHRLQPLRLPLSKRRR